MNDTDANAKALAESFVKQADDACIWKYEHEQLPQLPASVVCIVTVSVRHKGEGLDNPKRLLDVIKDNNHDLG